MRWLKNLLSPRELTTEDLAREIVHQLTKDNHAQKLEELFESMDIERSVGRREVHEFVAQSLTAALLGAGAGVSSDGLRDRLTETIERLTISEAFEAEEERADFADLYARRRSEYSTALAESREAPFRLANQLAENLTGGEGDAALAMVRRKTFSAKMIVFKQFVEETEASLVAA